MALVFTHVYTKRAEYSEYERDSNTIEVVVFFNPLLVNINDSFDVDIIRARRDRDEVVTSQTYTFSSLPSVDYLEFSFDMTLLRSDDSTRARLMRRGYYFIRAVDASDEDNYEDSDDFRVSVITVSKIKSTWLFGVPLTSFDLMKPAWQPRKVTGVTITDVTFKHPASAYNLTLNKVGNKKILSWAGGESVEVDLSHPIYPLKEYFLKGKVGSAGIKVLVDPLSLPTEKNTESLLIDVAKMDDTTIGDYILNAVDLIEGVDLQIFLEPTLCVTEVDPREIADSVDVAINSDWDKITTPVTYYGVVPGHWADIKFPFQYVQRVDYLMGSIANNRVLSVATEWLEKSYHSGFAQMVPLQMEMAFNYLALMWAPSLWGIRDLPNFWHYRALAGLREIPVEMLEYIGRRAAISILSTAGQAYRGGFAATSISRDGIAESVSYTSSAMYGVYSAYQQDHQNWINEHLPKFRLKYRGIPMTVL